MIKLVRSDDRMIHGQCIIRVLTDFSITKIIGVDDFTADNAILKRIFDLAMPPQISGGIFTVSQAIEEIKRQIKSDESTLVLMKNPISALALFEAINDLPKELNIGPLSNRANTLKATRYAYLTKEEIVVLNKLVDLGVRVYFNQVIDQSSTEWLNIRDNLK